MLPLPTLISTKLRLLRTNRIPHINNGGCAIVAHAVHEYLKTQGVESQILYLFRDDDEQIINRLKDGEPIGCVHAVVQVGSTIIDSEGSYTLEEIHEDLDTVYHIPVTSEYVLKSIQEGIWNPMFNREVYTPKIQQYFGVRHNYARYRN